MNRKRVMTVFLTLAFTGAACLTVQAAKPSGEGSYISGMEDLQESVANGDTDSDGAVESLMEGFEYVYTGDYNEEEGQELLMAFDTTNSYGIAVITQPATNELVWVCMGEWTQDDAGINSFTDADMGNTFNFTIDDETEEGMIIGLPDQDGGQLLVAPADLSELEDFFTKLVQADFAQSDMDTDTGMDSDTYMQSDDPAVAELMGDFSDVYYGAYNAEAGQDILLAFDYTNEIAITVILEPDNSRMVYACRGSYTSYDDGTLVIEDPDLGNTFSFTVNSQEDDQILIGLEEGELAIPAVNLSVLEQFYESMLNGDYAES